ncbi:MAG: PAS domain S-box protein [Fibrobacteria bacterium]|nr:PAS domain S-box protein [Fibrobacteria bacterium]
MKKAKVSDQSTIDYRLLFDKMFNGFALHEIITDKKGKPVDYRFLNINKAFSRLTGLKSDIIGQRVTDIIPGIEKDQANWIGRYGEVALKGKESRFEQFTEALNKWFSVIVFSPKTGQFATIFEDITVRKNIEKENESISRFPLENPNPVMRINERGTLLFANQASQPILKLWHCKEGATIPDTYAELVKKILNKKEVKEIELPVKNIIYSLFFAPILKDRYVNIYAHDITERKKSEEKYQALINLAPDAIFLAEAGTGILVDVNKHAETLIKRPMQELIGMHQTALHPKEKLEEYSTLFQQVMSSDETSGVEALVVDSFGKHIPVEITSSIIDIYGKKHLMGIFHDVTSFKNQEDKLTTALKDKELLLQELHHRVKNNLNLLSSLFSLQSSYSDNNIVQQALLASKNRVFSIAHVYDLLFQTKSLSQLNIKTYMQQLLGHIYQSLSIPDVHIKSDVANINLPPDYIIPCGLLINELISNALKYAFKDSGDKATKQITISLLPKKGHKEIKLEVKDNGVGLPKDFASETSGSLGMRLIHILTKQLNGKLTISSKKGADFKIIFPIPKEAELL